MNIKKKIRQELTGKNFYKWFDDNRPRFLGFIKVNLTPRHLVKRRRIVRITAVACAAVIFSLGTFGIVHHATKYRYLYEDLAIGIRMAKDVIANANKELNEHQRNENVSTVSAGSVSSLAIATPENRHAITKGMPQYDTEEIQLREQSRALSYCQIAISYYDKMNELIKEGAVYETPVTYGNTEDILKFKMNYHNGLLNMQTILITASLTDYVSLSINYDRETDTYSAYSLQEKRTTADGQEYIDIRKRESKFSRFNDSFDQYFDGYDSIMSSYDNFCYKYGTTVRTFYWLDSARCKGGQCLAITNWLVYPQDFERKLRKVLDEGSNILETTPSLETDFSVEELKEFYKLLFTMPESIKIFFHHYEYAPGYPAYGDIEDYYEFTSCEGDAYLTDKIINILPYQIGETIVHYTNSKDPDNGRYLLEGIYLDNMMKIPWPEDGIPYEGQLSIGVWLKWKRIATF